MRQSAKRSKHAGGRPIGSWGGRRIPAGLASRIVRVRVARGLTQEQAATQIGVSVRTLIRWEFGNAPSPLARRSLDAWLRKRGV
jgi:DNA-binding XRE family transcriptional regulator